MEGEGYRDPDIEDVFNFYLGRDEEFDLVAREVPYDTVGVDTIDLLAVNTRSAYAEFVDVPKNNILSTPAYEGLARRIRGLEEWTYSLESITEKSVGEEGIDGDIWISDTADIEAAEEFFRHVIGRDIFEELDPVEK